MDVRVTLKRLVQTRVIIRPGNLDCAQAGQMRCQKLRVKQRKAAAIQMVG